MFTGSSQYMGQMGRKLSFMKLEDSAPSDVKSLP